MQGFISRGQQIVSRLKKSGSIDNILAAIEWFDAALHCDVKDTAIQDAVKQARSRISCMRKDADNSNPMRIAAPFELQLILNRFKNIARAKQQVE